jgi:hypothetical protein
MRESLSALKRKRQKSQSEFFDLFRIAALRGAVPEERASHRGHRGDQLFGRPPLKLPTDEALRQGMEAMMSGPKVLVEVSVNFLVAGLQPLGALRIRFDGNLFPARYLDGCRRIRKQAAAQSR